MDKDVVQFRFLSDNERYADLINGIVFIQDNLDQGKSREEILEKLCRYYGMSRDKAEKYIESYHI